MNEIDKFELQGSLGVSSITPLHDMSSKALNVDRELRLNLSDVTDIDTAAIQVLLAAKKRAVESNASFNLEGISESVRATMGVAGVLDVFANDSAAPESPSPT